MKTDSLSESLAPIVDTVFGSATESMDTLHERAQLVLSDRRAIVWEGDASTFQFSYVSPTAEQILGYPQRRWTDEPTFWGQTVVHPDDRDDAIAYCAMATGKCQDHDFVYRAVRADGSVLWLHDIVKVIPGQRGVPERLRGIMLDITDEITATGANAGS